MLIRAIKTYFKGASFYNALLRTFESLRRIFGHRWTERLGNRRIADSVRTKAAVVGAEAEVDYAPVFQWSWRLGSLAAPNEDRQIFGEC
jgi:hypothetical protein